jgi:hypothetical protein
MVKYLTLTVSHSELLRQSNTYRSPIEIWHSPNSNIAVTANQRQLSDYTQKDYRLHVGFHSCS